jgi:hypothetical protein
MKNLHTFEEFLNESQLNESTNTDVGPKFVEEFLTNKRESFNDRFAFYGWVRQALPTAFTRNHISYNAAKSLADKASKKYPEYQISVVGGDDRPEEHQVWCSVSKAVNREGVYDVNVCQSTSMSDLDSMIKNFESNIKDLAKS